MSKSEAMLLFLMKDENDNPILHSPLFFNFINTDDIQDNNNHFISEDDRSLKTYIDGSALKQYNFTIFSYRTASYNQIILDSVDGSVKAIGENIDDFTDVQEIVDWINNEIDMGNKPDFGFDCVIENVEVVTNSPELNGVDTSSDPPLARYGIMVRVDYVDYSNAI